MEDGFEFFADRKLVTVFSAPKYCGEFDNAGGIMHVNEDLVSRFDFLLILENIIELRSNFELRQD